MCSLAGRFSISCCRTVILRPSHVKTAVRADWVPSIGTSISVWKSTVSLRWRVMFFYAVTEILYFSTKLNQILNQEKWSAKYTKIIDQKPRKSERGSKTQDIIEIMRLWCASNCEWLVFHQQFLSGIVFLRLNAWRSIIPWSSIYRWCHLRNL